MKNFKFLLKAIVLFFVIFIYSCSQDSLDGIVPESLKNEMTISSIDGTVKTRLQIVLQDGEYLLKIMEQENVTFSKEFEIESINDSENLYVRALSKNSFEINKKQNLSNLRVTDGSPTYLCVDNERFVDTGLAKQCWDRAYIADDGRFGFVQGSWTITGDYIQIAIVGDFLSFEEAQCLIDSDPNDSFAFCD